MANSIFIRTDRLNLWTSNRNNLPAGILFALSADFIQQVHELSKCAALGLPYHLHSIRSTPINCNDWIDVVFDEQYLPDFSIVSGSSIPLQQYKPIPHRTQLPTPTIICVNDTHFWVEGSFMSATGLFNHVQTKQIPITVL